MCVVSCGLAEWFCFRGGWCQARGARVTGHMSLSRLVHKAVSASWGMRDCAQDLLLRLELHSTLLLWVESQKTGLSSFVSEKERKQGGKRRRKDTHICQPQNAIYKMKIWCDIQLNEQFIDNSQCSYH